MVCASSSSARSMPKDALAACVPAMDWNTRSTGAPCDMACMVLVTWVSTQVCVGISPRASTSASTWFSRTRSGTLSDTGLMPTTASPAPCIRPSIMLATMPAGSSVGWLGCRRTERWPRRPCVLRKRVTTSQRLATSIRSWLRMSLLTAATISGVRPGASARSTAGVAWAESSQSRKAPTVSEATGAKACASWLSMISRVTSSSS